METIYFVLGMLSIIGVAFVATIVWGIVKITKLLKVIKQQEEWIMGNDRHMCDNIENLHRVIDKRVEELDRSISDSAINTISYVDSRIDKALALNGAFSTKQVIKG